MSLTEDLNKAREASAGRIPEDIRALMRNAVRKLAESGFCETALQVGDSAPDFTLPNAVGGKVALGQKLALGPVVLSFYRGAW